MAFLVEQVNTDGTIVCDYDQTLSVRALYERIATYFPGIYRDEDGIICGVYQGVNIPFVPKMFPIWAIHIRFLKREYR